MTPTPDPIKTILNDHELRTGVDLGDEIDRESLKQAINNELVKARQKLMSEIRAEAYCKARFELQAHARGELVDPNKIKWEVFEKYFMAINGMPDLTLKQSQTEQEKKQ